MSYFLQLSGIEEDGTPVTEDVDGLFSSLDAALKKAEELFSERALPWSEASRYRVKDEDGQVVEEGPLPKGFATAGTKSSQDPRVAINFATTAAA